MGAILLAGELLTYRPLPLIAYCKIGARASSNLLRMRQDGNGAGATTRGSLMASELDLALSLCISSCSQRALLYPF